MNVFQSILINIASDLLSTAFTTYVWPFLQAQSVRGFEPLLKAFITFIW